MSTLDGARDETYLLRQGIGAMGLDHGDDWMAETFTVDDSSIDGICGGTHRHVGSAVGAMGQRRQCPGWQRPRQGASTGDGYLRGRRLQHRRHLRRDSPARGRSC